MRIPDSLLIELLVNANKLKESEVDKFLAEGKKNDVSLQELAFKKQLITEKALTQLYAKEVNVPYVELEGKEIEKSVLQQIPERIARKYRVVLYDVVKGVPKLAMEDPDDLQAIDFLQKQLGQSLEVSVAPEKDILSALEEYKGEMSSEISKVATIDEEEEEQVEEVKEERHRRRQSNCPNGEPAC